MPECAVYRMEFENGKVIASIIYTVLATRQVEEDGEIGFEDDMLVTGYKLEVTGIVPGTFTIKQKKKSQSYSNIAAGLYELSLPKGQQYKLTAESPDLAAALLWSES